MSRTWVAIAAAAVGGLVVGLGVWLRSDQAVLPALSAAPRGAEVARLEDEVERLRGRLEHEAAMRAQLAAQVAQLGERLEALASDGEPVGALASDSEAREDAAARTPNAGGRLRVDVEALVEAGFRRSDVEALGARLDEIEMRRLYLRDQAAREGWAATGRHTREQRALRNETLAAREEFGDELFDWALYTSGRPNRVRVASVLSGSPAAEAGIQKGDVFERYDDSRILAPRDLVGLTSRGTGGALTAIDVDRGGSEVRFYVPRGPLGVRLEPIAQQPAPIR